MSANLMSISPEGAPARARDALTNRYRRNVVLVNDVD